MHDDDSAKLLQDWQNGDEAAAAVLFDRYVERMVMLARNQLSPKLRRRVDPDDVVQSAYRSFFAKTREGRYTVDDSGGLWPLLAAITLSKVRKQVEFNRAQKRSTSREASVDRAGGFGIEPELTARTPEPLDVICAVEELDRLMEGLSETHRNILELRLQHRSIDEIAEEVGRSERTVRRVLENLREELDGRLNELSGA